MRRRASGLDLRDLNLLLEYIRQHGGRVDRGPYRTPGEVSDMPRPIEVQFKVSLFLQGLTGPGMDSREQQAKDFERMLEERFVLDPQEFAKRAILAIEVTPADRAARALGD